MFSLKASTLYALEKMMNALLFLDEATPDKLRRMASKSVQITVQPLNFSFYIVFQDKAVQLLAHSLQAPDVCIESSPLGLIRLSFLPASKMRSLFHDGLKMRGDLVFGQEVKQLFEHLDIDWESWLAECTGDVVAYQAGQCLRRIKKIGSAWKESIPFTLDAYIHDELRLAPCSEEIQDFCDDVFQLSLAWERLKASRLVSS